MNSNGTDLPCELGNNTSPWICVDGRSGQEMLQAERFRVEPASAGDVDINRLLVEFQQLKLHLDQIQQLMNQLAEVPKLKQQIQQLMNQLEVANKEKQELKQRIRDLEADQAASARDPNESQSRMISIPLGRVVKEFSIDELKKATKDFNPSMLIAEGGFGYVYKGFLDNTTVAVKRHREDQNSPWVEDEFHREVDVLSRVRHPNIVELVGICKQPLCLVYEYAPNGSLQDHLFNANIAPRPLDWRYRIQIIKGICSALLSLHSATPLPIVHRDVKPSSILLGEDFTSKLSNFGIARVLDGPSSEGTNISNKVEFFHYTEPKGTKAYMAPESILEKLLTVECDVYAFGIIVLQLLTGRRDRGFENEVTMALVTNNLPSMIDNEANWPFNVAKQLTELGMQCIDPERMKRPSLSKDVSAALQGMLTASIDQSNEENLAPIGNSILKSESVTDTSRLPKPMIRKVPARKKQNVTEQLTEVDPVTGFKIVKRRRNEKPVKKLQEDQTLVRDINNFTRQFFTSIFPASSGHRNSSSHVCSGTSLVLDHGVDEVVRKNTTGGVIDSECEMISIHPDKVVTKFSFKELKRATKNFDQLMLIGEGGFGPVYKGFISNRTVVVKCHRSSGFQGIKEYLSEVNVLSRVRHPNIVELVGTCKQPQSLCLVYEYAPNGSLDQLLYENDRAKNLNWQVRIRIILDICSALVSLHSALPFPIVHRDVKPGNILLDEDFRAKLTDFGIARELNAQRVGGTSIYDDIDFETTVTSIMGTPGYLDPEYHMTLSLSVYCDIYAFGITVLVVLTGKRAICQEAEGTTHLPVLVASALRENRLDSLLDNRAEWPIKIATVLAKLGLQCADAVRRQRPSLSRDVSPRLKAMLKRNVTRKTDARDGKGKVNTEAPLRRRNPKPVKKMDQTSGKDDNFWSHFFPSSSGS